jgi:hypothetical protein
MNNIRKDIVIKINTQPEFKLTHHELEFIVENWITTHSQHISKVKINVDTNTPEAFAKVILDKESIYKHY